MKSFLIKENKLNFFLLILIVIYSFCINFYYANIGTFPIDTFLHFDSSYRILNKEYPVKDYWIVSGFIVDFIQSIFFKLFGANWNSYILHSSLFNIIISIFTYNFFLNLKIGKLTSFLYTLCFATLAYTISGTPFVDHHATFFLLIGTYVIIYAFEKKNRLYFWPIIVFLFTLSFLSKQVPAVYAIFLQGFLILFLVFKEKRYKMITVILASVISIIIIIVTFLLFLGIDLKLFYIQYLDYPRSIGSERFLSLNKSFESLFNQYKYLIIPIIITFILKIKRGSLSFKNDYKFYLFLLLGLSLVYHQILTKNQIYIYFLVPIFFSFLHSELLYGSFKLKKLFSIVTVICLVLITIKYHIRYNENRKFHELNSDLIIQSISANNIDKKFKELRWINPISKLSPSNEIKIIKEAKEILINDKKKLMLISHYSFFEIITSKKMNYPNRTHTDDGVSFPTQNKKYNKTYKSFFLDIIKSKSIKNIYFFKHEKISQNIVKNNIKIECLEFEENKIFDIYKIKENCLN